MSTGSNSTVVPPPPTPDSVCYGSDHTNAVRQTERPGRLGTWAFWLAPVALVILFLSWEPGDDGTVICPTRRLCGVWCPGCGMTRAVGHLVRGDWNRSLTYHPLAPAVLVQVVLGWLVFAGVRLGLWARPKRSLINLVLVLNVIALVVVWAYRFNAGAFDTLS